MSVKVYWDVEWECFDFNQNFSEIHPNDPIAYNGLALTRWQVIIWSNKDPAHWHIYASLGLNVLTHWPLGGFD